MDNIKTTGPVLTSSRRPAGVWIMSVVNTFVSGFFPILAATASLLVGSGPWSLFEVLLAVFQIGLGVAVIWTTVGAWKGNDHSRKAFLILLVIYHGLQVVGSLAILMMSGTLSQFTSRFSGVVVRSLFWVGINLWYFQRDETREWYEELNHYRLKPVGFFGD